MSNFNGISVIIIIVVGELLLHLFWYTFFVLHFLLLLYVRLYKRKKDALNQSIYVKGRQHEYSLALTPACYLIFYFICELRSLYLICWICLKQFLFFFVYFKISIDDRVKNPAKPILFFLIFDTSKYLINFFQQKI